MTRIAAWVVFALATVGCGSSGEASPPSEAAGAATKTNSNPAAELAVGSEVTPVGLEAFDALIGEPSNRPRIVNFWATWCPPCVAELPELEAFAKAHPEIDVVLVNTDHPSLRESKVKAFLSDNGITSCRNAQLDVKDQAGTLAEHVPEWPNAIPYTMVIEPSGKLRNRFTTGITLDQIEAAVDGL